MKTWRRRSQENARVRTLPRERRHRHRRWISRFCPTVLVLADSLVRQCGRNAPPCICKAPIPRSRRRIILWFSCAITRSRSRNRYRDLGRQRSGLQLFSPNTEYVRHSHQIGQRLCGHLPHDVSAVNLDRDFAHAEIGRNLLVHQTARDKCHHLLLARGQRLKPPAQLAHDGFAGPSSAVSLESEPYRIEQVLLAKGLGEDLDRG